MDVKKKFDGKIKFDGINVGTFGVGITKLAVKSKCDGKIKFDAIFKWKFDGKFNEIYKSYNVGEFGTGSSKIDGNSK